MAKSLASTFFSVLLFSCFSTAGKSEKLEYGAVRINWVEKLSGSFSFTKNWDYPEGVYRNDFGQLSCDGFCPDEVDRMKDEHGRIRKDSLARFYQLVDTTHLFYSIKSKTNSSEWTGTNFLTAERIHTDTIHCFTNNNAATHSSLELLISKNKCFPIIRLNSVASSTKSTIYRCKKGHIEIDRNLWNDGILKAKFDFTFDDTENPHRPIFWKGKIYAQILQQ